jgi:hypothetical protein
MPKLMVILASLLVWACHRGEPPATPVSDLATKCSRWADWCMAHDETPECINRVATYCSFKLNLAQASEREWKDQRPPEPNPVLMTLSEAAKGYSEGIHPNRTCYSYQVGNQVVTRCR